MDVSGRGAIVAGGASGLGAAAVRALAAAGAKVAVLDINIEVARKTAESAGSPSSVTSLTRRLKPRSIRRYSRSEAQVLVNCAGIAGGAILGREGPQPLDHYARCINVNVVGTFNMLRWSPTR